MRLLDWLLGRGRNPLAAPDHEAERRRVAAVPYVRIPDAVDPGETGDDARLAEEADAMLRQQAASIGVSVETLVELLDQREAFVARARSDPRTWGFDLAAAGTQRRDIVEEFRRASRLTGSLGESFLAGYEPLLAAAPDPLTMPDLGGPLDEWLVRDAGIDADAARDIAQHLRTIVQVRLGRPIDREHVEHAVREAAWDHGFDADNVAVRVIRAMEDVL